MSESTISEENAPNCAVCGNCIMTYPTGRVIATTKDGTVEYKYFCDTSCESAYHTYCFDCVTTRRYFRSMHSLGTHY